MTTTEILVGSPTTGVTPRPRPSVRRAAMPIVATIEDEDLTPTIVVTSAGTASMAEIKAAAREAWPIPGPLQLLESGMVRRKELIGGRKVRTTHYRTVFAPLVTEPCS